MHASKLIQVLKVLSADEFKSFGKFLKTTALDAKPIVKNSWRFFKILQVYHPEMASSRLEKEKIFARLFPEENFKKGKVEKQMTHLYALLEDFILEHHFGVKLDLKHQLALSQFYRSRGLSNLSAIHIKKYRKSLLAKEPKSTTAFYDFFLLEREEKDVLTLLKDTRKPPGFSEASKRLDLYYIYEKLELACELLSFHKMVSPVKIGTALTVLEQLEPLLQQGFFDSPVIHVYYKAYRLLQAEDDQAEEAFMAFEKVLAQNDRSIPGGLHKSLSALVRNYCLFEYHNGKEHYLKKAFLMYQEHLTKGYLYYEGKLFPATMSNIVTAGLRLKAYDWVLEFIQNHKSKIARTTSPEIVYQLNLANYYFHTAAYSEALDCLADTYEDVYYKLSTKRLELKIYFEMKHVLLSHKIDAFKIYSYRLNSKHIVEKQKEGNRNFIDLLKQIHHPATFQNHKRIDKLIQKINNLKFLSEKEWLLEKLNEQR